MLARRGLSPLVRLQRAVLLTSATALAFACGEKFTAVEPAASAGRGASPTEAGAAGEGATGVGGGPAGGRDGGGAGPVAGGGGSSGTANSPPDGGAAGDGGNTHPTPQIPLAGLQLWLRADQGVTATEQTVSAWQDVSGNQRDALQTARNYGPRLVKDALSGLPALVFDGEDDFLALPALDVDFSGGVSFFIAMQQEGSAYCEAYFEASTGPEENDLHFGQWEGSFNYEVFDLFVHDTNYPLLVGAPQIAVATQDAAGWVRVRSNGNGAGEGRLPLPAEAVRTQAFVGKSAYEECALFHGAIGELIVYDRAVTDPELLAIEQYLRDKWQCCDP